MRTLAATTSNDCSERPVTIAGRLLGMRQIDFAMQFTAAAECGGSAADICIAIGALPKFEGDSVALYLCGHFFAGQALPAPLWWLPAVAELRAGQACWQAQLSPLPQATLGPQCWGRLRQFRASCHATDLRRLVLLGRLTS